MADTCRSCGAPVAFVTSARTGRTMVLNVPPGDTGNVEVHGGLAYVVPHDQPALGTPPRYTSHHATCPDADRWRRR